MVQAFIDRVTTLSQVERLGVIRAMTRVARIIFQDLDNPPPNFSMVGNALIVLDNAGLSAFSTLDNITLPNYDALVLIERNAHLAEEDKYTVDVDLKYEHILEDANQSVFPPPQSGFLFGKGRSSITEKTTNFYRPFGDPNADRVPIAVAYTYTNEKEAPGAGYYDSVGHPFTIRQGGEITIPFPQSNFQLRGIVTTPNPQATADSYIALTNKDTWMGKPPFTWICSDVQWEVVDPNLPFQIDTSYKFAWEFQYNVDTWNPRVVFLDQRTGRPPADILTQAPQFPDENGVNNQTSNPLTSNQQDAAFWDVPALRPVNFGDLFPAFLEGN